MPDPSDNRLFFDRSCRATLTPQIGESGRPKHFQCRCCFAYGLIWLIRGFGDCSQSLEEIRRLRLRGECRTVRIRVHVVPQS
jgi:hypothetical protein